MARTYLTADNSNGKKVTAANPSFAHLAGWNAGVEIVAGKTIDGRDSFKVYMTGGSNQGRDSFKVYRTGGSSRATDVLLGTVRDTPEGPVFTPAREDEHGRY